MRNRAISATMTPGGRARLALLLVFVASAWARPIVAAQAPRSGTPGGHAVANEEQVAAERVGRALLDADPEKRAEAVRGLDEAGESLALVVLQQALVDVDPRVRSAAIDGLADLGGELAGSLIVWALVDSAAAVREDAVYALFRRGGALAREGAALALDDPDAGVRDAARQLLREVSRRPDPPRRLRQSRAPLRPPVP